MNKEDIEHMWKVASNNPNHDTNWYDPVVVAFAALVASAEREACAKVCEDLPAPERMSLDSESFYEHVTLDCADAIRARSNK